jgi:hypothetical protein
MISDGKRKALSHILSGYANNDDVTTYEALTAIIGLLDLDGQKTLRDEFAMAALNAIMQVDTPDDMRNLPAEEVRDKVARFAYVWANAMMEARK